MTATREAYQSQLHRLAKKRLIPVDPALCHAERLAWWLGSSNRRLPVAFGSPGPLNRKFIQGRAQPYKETLLAFV